MEYAIVGKDEGVEMRTGKDVAGPAPTVVVQGTPLAPTMNQIPKIPVYMDEDEEFVDFRKPGFWAYPRTVFSLAFGIVLLILFTAGGLVVGFIIGAVILLVIVYMARRMWRKAGYWFTNSKLVIHDGSRIRLIPYDEIALSSLSFEGENCVFTTVHQQEVILNGIIDMEQVVAFLSKSVKGARRGMNGAKKA